MSEKCESCRNLEIENNNLSHKIEELESSLIVEKKVTDRIMSYLVG